ncbi:MAG: hypothetical protein JRI23_31670 [Deltaproteobacteria bacterium]|jgi:hypothetical protein|nr:hypothetical protein [Deltaproteobacteria bacterium]MBW2536780.1 hypothetical protein [Deltaproteobacteria bacterium]
MNKRFGKLAAALALGAMGCSDDVGDVNLSVSALDTGPVNRSAVATFSPTTFQLPVVAVRLFGADEEEPLYEAPNREPVEFVRPDRTPALTANKQAKVGTYDTLEVEIGSSDGRFVIVGGCATLAAERHCTRTDTTGSSLGAGPEPVRVRSANSIDAVLTAPVEVREDQPVELRLYYDLTHAVSFLDEPGPSPDDPGFGRLGFGNGTSIEVKYPPMFAFIGQPPPVEIYELELTTDPDPSVEPNLEAYYYPSGFWRVRLWAFFDGAGEPLARRDIWIADEGADGAALVSMFNNDAKMERNADGSYTIWEPNPDPNFQYWRLDSFERESHSGTAQWTTPYGSKEIGYNVTRLQ